MKSNWQTKKLGELCTIELGKTPFRGNKDFWDKEKQTRNVWLSIADLLNADGRVISDSKEYISNKGAALSKIVKKGTLLASFKLTLGRLAFAGKDLYTNEAIAALNIKNEREVLPEYLYYYLTFFDWHAAVKGDIKIKGKTLNKAKLKEIDISFPPLGEQKQIVKNLDDAFEKLAEAKAITETNLQNSRELFTSYLNKIFSNPEKDWKEEKLGDVCGFVRGPFGGSLKKSIFKNEGYAVFEQQHAIYNQFDEIRYFIDENKFQEMKRFELKPGELIMSCSGTMGKIAVAPEGLKRGVINQALLKLSPVSDLLNTFLKYCLESGVFQNELHTYTKGAAIKNVVSVKILKDIKIFVPTLSKQKDIVKKLDSFSMEVRKLEAIYKDKLANLEELKRSVLKKTFSGKVNSQNSSIPTPPSNPPTQQTNVPSAYVRNQVHAAIIDQVERDGGWTTEVAVAKYDHLLQEVFGLPLGYDFQAHQFGPFDRKIKQLVYSGLGGNKWFTKRGIMIVFGSNIRGLLFRPSNLYRNAQSIMQRLSSLGITKLDADKVELLSTVCHSVKEKDSIALDKVIEYMSQWPTDNNRTKAQKFLPEETQRCLDFIVRNNLHQRLLKTT